MPFAPTAAPSPVLFIVATPIGNLDDLTVRAAKVLGCVDRILAEDTRTSQKLLAHLGIVKPLVPYHDFNKEKMTPRIIDEMRRGTVFALITDAGTPGIADPAFNLVREAVRAGLTVSPVPGPCAAVAALVCSGLPTDRFVFEYFLPPKSGRRQNRLRELAQEKRTVIFYESPHRILGTLEDMREVMGPVEVVIGRELTKVFEEFLRGTPQKLLEHFGLHPPKGEMTVLFNPRVTASDAAG